MAQLSYREALSSKPFRFIVGQENQELFIHSAAVASQSRALDVLVNGEMKEATEGYTTWEHVDIETFIRFSQYVYTGNYDSHVLSEVPMLDTKNKWDWSHNEELPPEEVPETIDSWEVNLPRPKKSKKKKSQYPLLEEEPTLHLSRGEMLWQDFQHKRSYDYGSAGPHLTEKNDNAQQEYKEVFLSHARLHDLADYYKVDKLAQLTLHKLHRTLADFELHEERIIDVVSLLHFCYEEDGRDKLRELVVAYSVCNFEKLWKSGEFQQLFGARAELSMAIMEKLLSRLD